MKFKSLLIFWIMDFEVANKIEANSLALKQSKFAAHGMFFIFFFCGTNGLSCQKGV